MPTHEKVNVFVKPDEQRRACSNIVMARKEQLTRSLIHLSSCYSQTELHLENCCLQRARRALHGISNHLRGRKGVLLFADDAAVAFQISFCLTIKASLLWHIMRKKQRGVLHVPYVLMSRWTCLCQNTKDERFR